MSVTQSNTVGQVGHVVHRYVSTLVTTVTRILQCPTRRIDVFESDTLNGELNVKDRAVFSFCPTGSTVRQRKIVQEKMRLN
jgi:hypothetical protein